MLVLDGIEAIREISRLERERGLAPARIIVLTANADPADADACRRGGVDGHLTKSIERHASLAALETARRPVEDSAPAAGGAAR